MVSPKRSKKHVDIGTDLKLAMQREGFVTRLSALPEGLVITTNTIPRACFARFPAVTFASKALVAELHQSLHW